MFYRIYGFYRLSFLIVFVLINCVGSSVFSNESVEFSSIHQQNQGHIQIALTKTEKAFIKAHPIIRFGTDATWAPYVAKGPDGALEGFDVDYINFINEISGVNIELVTGQWVDMVNKAKGHEIDGLATSAPLKARADHFNFSDKYISELMLVIVSADSTLEIGSFEDLNGKTVAFQKGNELYLSLLKPYPGISILETISDIESAQMVIVGKADASISATSTYNTLLQNYLTAIKIAHVVVDKPLDLVFSIRKDWPLLQSIINKSLASLSSQKKHSTFARWFGFNPADFKANKDKIFLTFSAGEQKWLSEKHIVRIPAYNVPPLIFNKDKVSGITIDYLDTIAMRAGFKIEYVTDISIAEALKDINTHEKIDLLPFVSPIKERKKDNILTNSYISAPWFIFTRENAHFIGSLDDLSEKKVGIVNGLFITKRINKTHPTIKTIPAKTPQEGLKALSRGELDAFIVSSIVGTYIVKRDGLTNIKIAAPIPSIDENTLSMAIRKDWPELSSIINKTLATITHEEHTAFRSKWIADLNYGIGKIKVIKWGIGLCSIAFLIILIISRWNKKLAKEVQERKQVEKQIQASLKEKEILLKELYHRTKNNMQVIMAMINLQTQEIEDEKTLQIFNETTNKISTMALVHEKLYQTKDLSRIDLKDYFTDLINLLSINYQNISEGIRIKTDMSNVLVTIDSAIPCGLIFHELISNAFKYAFPENQGGEIQISLKITDDQEIELTIGDDGIGLPEGFEYRDTDTMGLQTVIGLAEGQLLGSLSVTETKGTHFQIRFKEKPYQVRV